MKKMVQVLLSAVIAVSLVFGMVACSKDNPKSLAKEAYEISQLVMDAISDPAKMVELQKRSEAISAKIDKLSDADKKLVQEEMVRLMGDTLDLDNDDEELDEEDVQEQQD